MRLRLSSDFAVDTDAYKKEGLRISILAMSGHGKSNAAADLVEDVLDNHAQVIIIEPIPEWHTLKATYDNVVVIGGPYQDLPLEPAFAHEYVLAALEKGISLVVNVSDIEDDVDQVRFVSSFLWNLYRLEQKYRRVIFLVLEEADTWAPQNWDQNTKPSLSRVSLIAKHGRKIGIFPILVSQRPADLHKSPLSQCNINLFGKFTSPADLDPKTGIMYVVKKLHLPITEEMIMKLETGNFVISDKAGVHTVAVRKRLCPHGADTPLIEAKPFTADLSHALSNLRDEITKALEAKKEEQSEIKRLEHQVQDLKKLNEQLQEKANIKLSVKEMIEGNTSVTPTTLTTPNVVPEEFAKVKDENLAFRQQLEQDKGIIEKLEKELKPLLAFKEALINFLGEYTPKAGPAGFEPGTSAMPSLSIAEIDERINQRLAELGPTRVVAVDISERMKELVKTEIVNRLVAKIQGLPEPAKKAAVWLHQKKHAKIGDVYFYMYEKTGRIPGPFYGNVINPLENAWLAVNDAGNVRWTLDEKLAAELKGIVQNGEVEQMAKYLTSLLL